MAYDLTDLKVFLAVAEESNLTRGAKRCHHSPSSEVFDEGDQLEMDLETARVRNITKGKELVGEPFSKDMLEIVAKGGILSTV